MGWGTTWAYTWGTGLSSGTGPSLVSSSPSANSYNQASNVPVSFVIDSTNGIDPLSVSVFLDGVQIMSGGVFISPVSGTAILVGTQLQVSISGNAPFLTSQIVDCVIYATDDSLLSAVMSFSFSLGWGTITNLQASTWCAGNRIQLSWNNPAGTTRTLVLRSPLGFCELPTDSGFQVYSGAPIESFDDQGVAGYLLQSNAFYYYTVFYSFNTSAPYAWHTTQADGQVIGLSIKNYAAVEGPYVLNRQFPKALVAADVAPTRGSNSGLLAYIADSIQCGVNLVRGFADGLALSRDTDLMPTGQIGLAQNQRGMLHAQLWDYNFPVQPEFDIPSIRRLMANFVDDVLKLKGTCPGLVNLVNYLTGWTLRCDELINPVCGVDRVLRSYDGASEILLIGGTNSATEFIGELLFDPAYLTLADGVTVTPYPDVADFIGVFIIDAMGTFACVESITQPPASAQVVVSFENAAAMLRTSITGTGVGAAGSFTIQTVDTSAYPWQFPSTEGYAPPVWGANAWKGYYVQDQAGSVFLIASSGQTDISGHTLLTLSGTPASGTYTLAQSFSSGSPVFGAKLYCGRFSLAFNPQWDIRLAKTNAVGPWSSVSGVQAGVQSYGGFGGTLSDLVLWMSGVAQASSTVTSAGANYVTDSTQNWAANQWVDTALPYYLNPNWNQSSLYRIIGNTGTELVVDDDGIPLNYIADTGATYAILAYADAQKYIGLARMLSNYAVFDANIFMKFE